MASIFTTGSTPSNNRVTTPRTDPLSVPVRISDHLAALRLLYPRPLPTLPDILLISIPASHASASLPLGRYYPVMLETGPEATEFDAFLHAERTMLRPPDLLDQRPSALQTDDIIFARYAPPASGWPWLLLCCWPTRYTVMAPAGDDHFARAAYTIEVLTSPSDLDACEERLLAVLQPVEARRIVHIDAIAGHA